MAIGVAFAHFHVQPACSVVREEAMRSMLMIMVGVLRSYATALHVLTLPKEDPVPSKLKRRRGVKEEES